MAAGVSDGALIIDTGLDNKGLIRDARQFKRAVETLTQAVKSSGQQMAGGMDNYLKALSKAGGAAKAATGEQAALQKEIEKTSAAIKRLEERQELARRKFEAAKEEAIADAAAKFEDNNKGLGALPWEDEAKAAEQYAEDFNVAMQKAADAFGAFEDTTAFRNTSVELEVLKEKLAELQTQQADLGGEAGPATTGLAGGFARVAAAAGRALAVLGKFAGHGAVGFLKKLAAGAKNAAIQLAKLAANAVKGGIKKLGGFIGRAVRSMLGFGKASKGAESSFGALLKRLLSFGAIIALLKKAFNAAKEGMNELAKQNPAVKGAVDSLRASLNGLKGSLATAFAPILTAVAPALSTLINMLTSAINAIGAFMAALTGQKTYQAAVAGLEATGGAASGAAGEVKDLKRELAGFDELNILGKSDSSGGGGGGGGGGGSAFGYETQEISGGITDFVAKLKELWANADYEGIGQEIAGAINRAFERAKDLISWDSLGEKITEAVNAITGILNGLVDGIDWDLIGRTFGTGINTITNTANQLLTKINWTAIGAALATGLNGLVDEVNWDNLGAVFGNRFNAITDALRGAARSFDWSTAGTAFATAISGLLNTVNWDGMADSASALFNGVLRALRIAANEFDWSSQGTNFATAINGLITGFDWKGLGETAASSFNGVLRALRVAANEFEWSSQGTNFAAMLNSLITGFDWTGLGDTATASINGVLRSLRAAVNAFEWSSQGKNFAAMLNSLITGFDWKGLGETAASSFNGVLRALRVAANEFDWSSQGKNFATALNSLIKDFDWNGLANAATASINGPLRALRAAVNNFDWSSQGTNFGNTINKIIKDFDWEGLGSLASEGIEKPLEALRAAVSTFDFKEAADGFADTVNAFFKNEKLWENAGTVVSDAVKGLFTWGAEFLDNLDAEQIAADIQTFISSIDWGGIAQALWTFVISACRSLGNLFLAMIFGPDYKDSTKKKQEVEDYMSGLLTEMEGGRNFSVNWGLNLYADVEMDAFNQLGDAITAALESGEWVAPIGLDVPPESIEAARQEFIKEWNLIHPEAPIDPTLPPDAGTTVKSKWAQVKPELKADAKVDLTKNPTGKQTAESLYTAADKKVQGKVSLFKGTDGNQTVDKVYSATDKVVKGNTQLNKGTSGTQTVDKVYTAADKTVKGATQLNKGTSGNQTVSNVYTAAEKAVKGATQLVKGTSGAQTVDKVYSATDKALKGTVSLSGTKADVRVNALPGTGIQNFTDGDYNTLKPFNWINTRANLIAGTGIASFAENGGLNTFNGFHWVNTRANLEAGTGINSLGGNGGWNWLNAFHETGAKISGEAGNGFASMGSKNTLNGISSAEATVNGKNGTGFSSFGKTNKMNAIADQTVKVSLSNTGTNWAKGILSWITDGEGKITATIDLVAGTVSGLATVIANAIRGKAEGGVFANGVWSKIPQYAGGTLRAGSIFAAGEAGPELVGHIGNRTEVLNKSQLASTMFTAVSNGMLNALSRIRFREPVMATGAVLPYEVVAQIAQSSERIENTLNANNEDLIQTIISVAGQLVTAIGQIQTSQPQAGLGAQQLINEINRRTQMFSASPLQGV